MPSLRGDEAAVGRLRARHADASEAVDAVRVLVVDELAVMRAGVHALISGVRDMVVIGETEQDAAASAAQRLRPHVVIIDPLSRHADGFSTMRAIRAAAPDARLLVMTGSDEPDVVVASIAAGADGYLLNDAGSDRLLDAIRRLREGRAVIDPDLAVGALRRGSRRRGLMAALPEPLTPRELEVLRLMSRGQTNAQIGSRLFVAAGTIKAHVEHILAKLGAADRTEASVRAAGMGLLEDGEAGQSRVPTGG